MARPLIRRRIRITGQQRTDIDADLLIQALIQIAEDETTQTGLGTDPAVRTRSGTPSNRNTPARRPMSSTAPSPHRPSRTRSRRAARNAAGRSANNKHTS